MFGFLITLLVLAALLWALTSLPRNRRATPRQVPVNPAPQQSNPPVQLRITASTLFLSAGEGDLQRIIDRGRRPAR